MKKDSSFFVNQSNSCLNIFSEKFKEVISAIDDTICLEIFLKCVTI